MAARKLGRLEVIIVFDGGIGPDFNGSHWNKGHGKLVGKEVEGKKLGLVSKELANWWGMGKERK